MLKFSGTTKTLRNTHTYTHSPPLLPTPPIETNSHSAPALALHTLSTQPALTGCAFACEMGLQFECIPQRFMCWNLGKAGTQGGMLRVMEPFKKQSTVEGDLLPGALPGKFNAALSE